MLSRKGGGGAREGAGESAKAAALAGVLGCSAHLIVYFVGPALHHVAVLLHQEDGRDETCGSHRGAVVRNGLLDEALWRQPQAQRVK